LASEREPRTRASGGERIETLRAIPSDHEAESAVLGALILDHDSYFKVEDKLSPAAFDLPRHRILYEACVELAAKQQAATLITLRSYLDERGLLDQIGGVAFLSRVADAVPTAAHVEHHANILREKALARALIRSCEEISARGYSGLQSVDELLEQAEREILQIAVGHAEVGFSSMRDEIPGTFEYIERVQAGEIVGVKTGFDDFDRKTGGLLGGELVVIAARPSMGKTALVLNAARNHAVDDSGCVAFFSLEMTKRELVMRLLLSEAQVDSVRFQNGMLSDEDWRRLTRAATTLEGARLYLDDSMAVSVGDIAARARRLHREQNISLLVIDYIQLIQGRHDTERREQQVADISRSLKLLSKDLDIPVIAVSQLNRGPENRPDKRPQLADLRESGAIEQDADHVVFIYRDEVYDEDSPDQGIAEVIIAKQRSGPVGTTKLQFEKRYASFHNLAGLNAAPPVEAGFDPSPGVENWGGGGGGDSEPPF
jgi:replicative DNA helicase